MSMEKPKKTKPQNSTLETRYISAPTKYLSDYYVGFVLPTSMALFGLRLSFFPIQFHTDTITRHTYLVGFALHLIDFLHDFIDFILHPDNLIDLPLHLLDFVRHLIDFILHAHY